MLTGYVFFVPLNTKAAEKVIQAYIDNVYSKFGGSLKMLSDNGTEFKNKIFEQVSKELGLEYKLYTPPYHLASNGRIEGFCAVLKACIAKQVAPQFRMECSSTSSMCCIQLHTKRAFKGIPFLSYVWKRPCLSLEYIARP